MRRAGLAVALVAGLAACARGPLSVPEDLTGAKWDVDAVKALPENTDPYFGALQRGFVALADEELAEFDWVDAAYFTGRARAAAAGQEIAPVEPAARRLDPALADELSLALTELGGFVASPGGRLRAGRQIGEAQVHYECWVQEAEEAHQSAEIDICRDLYTETMILVRALAPLPENIAVVLDDGQGVEISGAGGTTTLDTPFAAGSVAEDAAAIAVEEGEIRDAFADALDAQPKPPVRFTLTFDFNRTSLDDEAFAQVDAAVAEAQARPVAEVIITGFADAVGGRGENLAISRSRASAVRRAVAEALGEPEEWGETISIATRARGERDLAEPTQAQSRLNRRVVILVR